MEKSVIVIDLKEFEGKSIYEFKMKIAETLRNIVIQYTIPSPMGVRNAFIHPYSNLDVSGVENNYLIENIEK